MKKHVLILAMIASAAFVGCESNDADSADADVMYDPAGAARTNGTSGATRDINSQDIEAQEQGAGVSETDSGTGTGTGAGTSGAGTP